MVLSYKWCLTPNVVIDFIQEHILGQGDQSNESALEQLKDEQISDAVRLAWRQVTGHEFPAQDKH